MAFYFDIINVQKISESRRLTISRKAFRRSLENNEVIRDYFLERREVR